jgi:hypothetical protein
LLLLIFGIFAAFFKFLIVLTNVGEGADAWFAPLPHAGVHA